MRKSLSKPIFEKIGLDHVSPSNLNTWANSPAIWAIRYGMGFRGQPTPKMSLGKAVERGLQEFLRDGDFDRAQHEAVLAFNMDLADPLKETKERDLIKPMLDQAIDAMVTLNPEIKSPPMLQSKASMYLKGIPVPCIGYTDFEFDGSMIVELKTTQRMPSSPSPSHMRQIAFYWKATGGKMPSIMYVTPKAFKIFQPTVDELAEAFNDLVYTGQTLVGALSVIEKPQDLFEFYPPDFSNYQWEEEEKQLAKRIIKKITEEA